MTGQRLHAVGLGLNKKQYLKIGVNFVAQRLTLLRYKLNRSSLALVEDVNIL